MSPKIRQILIGIIFILAAAFCGLTAFYYLKVKPAMEVGPKSKTAKAKITKSKSTASPVKASTKTPPPKAVAKTEPAKTEQVPPVTTVTAPKGMTLNSLVKEAQKVYGTEVASNKEGYLWVDRKNSKYVVTLGALNGVTAGKQLSVYQGGQRVGQVVVDISFDVISYVHPSEDSKDALSGDYYKVAVE